MGQIYVCVCVFIFFFLVYKLLKLLQPPFSLPDFICEICQLMFFALIKSSIIGVVFCHTVFRSILFKVIAFITTITVERLITKAPISGRRKKPRNANTPAAAGMATIL
jgi:hypothetical protein